MGRILLVHWNAAEAKERCERLKRAGHQSEYLVPKEADSLAKLVKKPPDAFIIDLSRRPVEGAGIGALLRKRRATRHIPMVFAEGAAERITRIQKMFPDAVFSPWSRIRGSLRRAMQNPPKSPAVPGAFDAYSGTPLVKKLGIKSDSVVALLGSPEGFETKLGALPENVRIQKHARSKSNLILLFAKNRAVLERRFPAATKALAHKGGLWIAWPKKASGVATDLTQNDVRKYGLDSGLVDYKICAIDATWSGLLFARRLAGQKPKRS